jgi:hypothetical protein
MTSLDSWLEEQLGNGFVPFSTAPIPAGAPYRTYRPQSAGPWFAARLATRTGVILVAAACGLMATGALAAAAVTGTANPQVWSLHLTMAISTCAGQGATGQSGGIGACVDAVVHYRGPKSFEQRARDGTGSARPLAPADPGATPDGTPADGKKGGPASSPGPDPNAIHGRPPAVPVGPPADQTHGRPSGVPAGPATPHGNAPTAHPTPQGNPPTAQPTPHGKASTAKPTPQGKAPTAPPIHP